MVSLGLAGNYSKKGKKMVYSWKNYGYSVGADVVGKEFEAIESKYGEITSQYVLQEAADENNPMHELFEWDDTVAANKYRLHQASVLICNLAVEVEDNIEEKKLITRAYVDISDSDKGSFINVVSAFKNPDSKTVVLQRAYNELAAFKAKYQNLSELALIINSIDEVLVKAE